MNTRIQDFVKDLSDYIKQLPRSEKSDLELLPRIESFLSIIRLQTILRTHEKDESELDKEKLEVFRSFLTARWKCIHGTDAIYTHQPDSPITQVCVYLANELSKFFNVPVYDLLMPPLQSAQYKTSKGDLRNLKLREFILSDKGEPIEVLTCLDRFMQNNRLYHTCLNQAGESEDITLSNEEMNRIIHHSACAEAYYLSILKDRPIEEIQENRAALLNLLVGDAFKIHSHYPPENNRRIASFICASVNTANDLVAIIYKHVPASDRHVFIQLISDKDLFRLILGIEGCASLMQAQTILASKLTLMHDKLRAGQLDLDQSEEMAGIYFICLIDICKRCREAEPEYKSFSGYYLGSYLPRVSGTYDKETRLKTFDLLLTFLVENQKLARLPDFLNLSVPRELLGAFNSGTTAWLKDELFKLRNFFEQERTTVGFQASFSNRRRY